MPDDILQAFNELARFLFAEILQAGFFVVFPSEIDEMVFVPSCFRNQVLDIHFLTQSDAVTAASVMTAADEIVHEPAETLFIQVPGRAHAGIFLEDIAVLIVGESEFLFDDMNDSEFISVHFVTRLSEQYAKNRVVRFAPDGSIFPLHLLLILHFHDRFAVIGFDQACYTDIPAGKELLRAVVEMNTVFTHHGNRKNLVGIGLAEIYESGFVRDKAGIIGIRHLAANSDMFTDLAGCLVGCYRFGRIDGGRVRDRRKKQQQKQSSSGKALSDFPVHRQRLHSLSCAGREK